MEILLRPRLGLGVLLKVHAFEVVGDLVELEHRSAFHFKHFVRQQLVKHLLFALFAAEGLSRAVIFIAEVKPQGEEAEKFEQLLD